MKIRNRRSAVSSRFFAAESLELRRLLSQMTVTGTAFVDSNLSGLQDPGEPGLAGVTVFQDLNYTGVYAAGDPFAVSDSNGNYTINNIQPTTKYSPEIIVEPVSGYREEETGTSFSFYAGTTLTYSVPLATQSYVKSYVQLNVGQNAFEALANVTVYADLNNDGVLDAGDISAVTNYTGEIQFGGLPQGTVTMRVIVPQGYSLYNGGGAQSITVGTLTASTVYFQLIQGSGTTGSITGTDFTDYNGDGIQQSGEPGYGGAVVYLDLNEQGFFNPNDPTATTSANGSFSFTGLTPGNYTVREVLPSGYYQSTQVATVTVTAGASTSVQIGTAEYSSISGSVYNDSLGDGFSTGNAPLPGVTIFLDLNGNGVLESNDPFTVSDPNGNYTLNDLPAGTFELREVVPTGDIITQPQYAGEAGYYNVILGGALLPSAEPFGDFKLGTASGVVFSDTNGDGIQETGEPGLAGWTVFADINNTGIYAANDPSAITGSSGSYQISGLAPGTHSFYATPPAGSTLSAPVQSARALSGSSLSLNYAVKPVVQNGVISGEVYIDQYDTGVYNPGTDAGLAGWTVYADLNNNGVFDPGEPSTLTNAYGDYSLTTNSSIIRVASQAGWSGTAQNSSQNSVSFGEFKAMTLTGVVYGDANANGQRDVTEAGLSGVTIYDDLNDNMVLDAGEPSTVSGANGLFTLTGIIPPAPGSLAPLIESAALAGYRTVSGGLSVAPSSGQNINFSFAYVNQSVVAGSVSLNVNPDGGSFGLAGVTVYADLNNDGIEDAGDIVATTDGAGSFRFGGVPTGAVTVRVVIPSGYTLYSGSAAQTLSVGTQTVSYAIFTLASASRETGSIDGVVFQDANGNGIQDPGELPASGRTVYLDMNDDGNLDPGDPSVVTDTAGRFEFPFLAVGNYTVREVLPTGMTQTFPIGGGGLIATVGTIAGYASNDNQLAFGSQITPHPTAVFSGSTIAIGASGTVGFTSVSDASALDANGPFTFSYDFNNDGVHDLTSTAPTATVPASYLATTGSHTIGGEVTDKDGYSTTFTTTIQVNASASAKLSGTVIGTSGSYKNDGNTASKAFDGNLTTFFDGPTASGNWVGLDLGSAKVITSLAYVSRSGWASRMNGGVFQASNSATFSSGVVNLYTIASNANPSSNAFTTQSVTNTNAFRYVRYYSPANSYGDVAEIEFFGRTPAITTDTISGIVSGAPAGLTVYLDANNNSVFDSGELSATTSSNGSYSFSNVPAGTYVIRQVLPGGYTQVTPAANGGYAITVANGSSFTTENFTDKAPVTLTKFTGSTIGTSGSYQNDGNTIAKATDGNLTTFFDGPAANGNWVGLDLGSAKIVKEIEFAPRSGWASRMVGGIFQASNSANFSSGVVNLYTISSTPSQGVLTTQAVTLSTAYRYYRYLSPNGSYGDISEFQLFG